jgi:hypothetical protein
MIAETLIPASHPMTWERIYSMCPHRLWWLLPDDMLPEKYRKERPPLAGVPQTVRVQTDKPSIPFTEDLQRFIYSLNFGLVPAAFAGMMDAWSLEGGKVRDNADFIAGERLGATLPKLPSNLLFGCNVVAEVRRFTWGDGGDIDLGEDVIEIESIHPDNLPDPFTLPLWLRHHLTIIHTAQYQGRQKVIRFPHNNGAPCYTAIISPSPLYIETARCRAVTIPPPVYWP